MPLLFRSPNIQIDGAERHVSVLANNRRSAPYIAYRWRRSDREMWQPITKWPGRLPLGLRERFGTYRKAILFAIASAAPRKEAA